MPEMGSSVPRRQLGRFLRQERERAGLTIDAAAKHLEWGRGKLYRIEGGETPLRRLDVIAMCDVYRSAPDTAEALAGLASETKNKGWWHAYGDVVPAWFELYVGLEVSACAIRKWEPVLVPGLLQTPEYAAAVIGAKPGITEAEVGQAVKVRIERQQLLARRRPVAPELDVIIDESVLRRSIADREGMQRQLIRLGNYSDEAGVTVRILPLSVGPQSVFVAGAFAILDFAAAGTRGPEPTTVYSESLTGALYLDKPGEVTVYEEAWRALDELALDVEASRDLLATIDKESAANA